MPFTIGGEWIPEQEPKKNTGKPVKVIKEKRGNSQVTLVLNMPLDEKKLKVLCSELKQKLGCGGSVKDDVIELQGDKIEQVNKFLKELKKK